MQEQNSSTFLQHEHDVAQFFFECITLSRLPKLPDVYANDEFVVKIYNDIVKIRSVLFDFSKGNFDVSIDSKTIIGSLIKSVQANIRHLTWQMDMVAHGDFEQRISFMGDFSASFNNMVLEFEKTVNNLKKQKELLNKEISNRKKTEAALKESEKRYKKLASQDFLTGLYNRRHFYEVAMAEVEKLCRGIVKSCVIAMLDIDYFKLFNDNYGHQAGDLCLQSVANMLTSHLRKFDIVARYGGEEFIIFLPQADIVSGMNILERIRLSIENTEILQGKHVTISIGYSFQSSGKQSETADQILTRLIKEADKALYSAKIKRNNTYFYDKNNE